MSARNSAELWDLRAYAREKIIAFVHERCPEALPRLRVEHTAAGAGPATDLDLLRHRG